MLPKLFNSEINHFNLFSLCTFNFNYSYFSNTYILNKITLRGEGLMRVIFLAIIVFVATPSFAESFGRFQLKLNNGLSGTQDNITFLLRKNGESKVIYKSSYSELLVHTAAGMTSLDIRGQGDEDFTVSKFLISGNQIVVACSAIIDKKNDDYALEDSTHELLIWSKSAKKYVVLPDDTEPDHQKMCHHELIKTYMN